MALLTVQPSAKQPRRSAVLGKQSRRDAKKEPK
jgi:hypothetical protein